MKRKVQEQTVIKSAAGAPLSNSPDAATRRLDNIRTREVSLVDNAANGRSFLVVKRNEQVKPKDKTLFKGTEAAPAAATTEAAPTTTESPTATPVEKGEFEKLADKFLQSVPVSKALAMEQKSMFMAMSDALVGMSMAMDMIQSDLMSFMSSDGKTGFMGEEVMKGLKIEFPEASESELVEKAGKKMKKDRLAKLKKLRDEMDTLIKELDDETDVTKGGTVGNPVKQEKTGTEQPTNKAAGAEGATEATETPAATTEAAAPAAAAPAANLTAEQIGDIVTKAVDKAVAPLKSEIETLKNAPAAPAGESTETTEEVNKGADGKNAKQESIFKGLIR